MSTAIAQNATQLTVSNGSPDWADTDFELSVKRCAERTAKGVTRERHMLQRNKLVSGVCADYRSHFASVYGKTDRLPTAIFERIEAAVDSYINSKLREVNPMNVVNYRRSFYHNSRDMEITERIAVTGENKLTLKEQLLGVTIYITQAEKRLKDLESKPSPDYEREKAVKQQILKLQLTKDFILGEMKHQESVETK